MASTAVLVKELRDATGAGFMDCKRALSEAGGDVDRAKALLREWGVASAAKKAGRETKLGTIVSYIHHNNGVGRVGALVEINCETDFVARTDQFKQLAQRIAQHIVAAGPEYLGEEHVPAELDAETRAEVIRDRLLLTQRFLGGTQTVEEVINEAIAALGENIRVGRFTRYTLGEE